MGAERERRPTAGRTLPPDPLLAVLTAGELVEVAKLSPLPAPPANTTNQYADNPMAAVLGQKLFFDKRYSGPLAIADDGSNGGLGTMGEAGKISCASCHLGAAWTIGGRDPTTSRWAPTF